MKARDDDVGGGISLRSMTIQPYTAERVIMKWIYCTKHSVNSHYPAHTLNTSSNSLTSQTEADTVAWLRQLNSRVTLLPRTTLTHDTVRVYKWTSVKCHRNSSATNRQQHNTIILDSCMDSVWRQQWVLWGC